MKRDKRAMVYTPELHIPFCEGIMTASGEVALRIKKNGCNEYEVVSLGRFMTLLTEAANGNRK